MHEIKYLHLNMASLKSSSPNRRPISVQMSFAFVMQLAVLCAIIGHGAASSCHSVCACKWKGGKQTVECIDRALITIPEDLDSSTQVLDMSGNNLQILPRDTFNRIGLTNLQRIYLRNCRLGQIDGEAFSGLTNLVELDLSSNLLTAVPSAILPSIPSLRDLTIAGNPIQKIESHVFKATQTLNKLDLSHCDIQAISPDAFKGLTSLHSLKLNGNKLTELRTRTVDTLSKLHNIELHDNPWICDCRMRAAKIWLTDKNIPLPVPPVCVSGPESVVDRKFDELTADDFACKPEMKPMSRFIESSSGENATIVCRVSAVPSATINWYWNGRQLVNGSSFSSYQRVYIMEDGDLDKTSRLILSNAQEADSGEFYCSAENRAGTTDANFTLHVTMRAAGMASLGSSQIVGLSAALLILMLFILLTSLFMLYRVRRIPFAESKTPGHLEVVTTVNAAQATVNGKAAGNLYVDTNNVPAAALDRKDSGDSKSMNPVQKPPRLTDITYSTSHYDGGNGSIIAAGGGLYASPTASAGNNPDLINDTKRFGSDEFNPLALGDVSTLQMPTTSQHGDPIERLASGEYSRAGGCDSLYPSGFWDHANGTNASALAMHQQNQQSIAAAAQDLYLKRVAAQQQMSAFGGSGNLYTEKTPIIENIHGASYDDDTSTHDYISRTFPRTTIAQHLASYNGKANSEHMVAGEQQLQQQQQQQQQQQHHHHQQYHSNSLITNNNNINANNKMTHNASNLNNMALVTSGISATQAASSNGYPVDYGLPIVAGAEHHKSRELPPTGMANAKTLRVWQKGGVPVLPPVTALKRALTSSRNSPDEGYQEGCGTDV